jgi:hypothetical protein
MTEDEARPLPSDDYGIEHRSYCVGGTHNDFPWTCHCDEPCCTDPEGACICERCDSKCGMHG